jgi:hypothetical protein
MNLLVHTGETEIVCVQSARGGWHQTLKNRILLETKFSDAKTTSCPTRQSGPSRLI